MSRRSIVGRNMGSSKRISIMTTDGNYTSLRAEHAGEALQPVGSLSGSSGRFAGRPAKCRPGTERGGVGRRLVSPYRESVAVPIQNFDAITAPRSEHKQVSSECIQFQVLAYHRVQPVKTLAH